MCSWEEQKCKLIHSICIIFLKQSKSFICFCGQDGREGIGTVLRVRMGRAPDGELQGCHLFMQEKLSKPSIPDSEVNFFLIGSMDLRLICDGP